MTIRQLRNSPAFPIHHLRALGRLDWARHKSASFLLHYAGSQRVVSTYGLVNAQKFLLDLPGKFISEALARKEEDLLAKGYDRYNRGEQGEEEDFMQRLGEAVRDTNHIAYARPSNTCSDLYTVTWAYSIAGNEIPLYAQDHTIFLKRKTIRPRFI